MHAGAPSDRKHAMNSPGISTSRDAIRTIPGLSQAGHHVPRHHHAARQCARLPPRGRRIGAALGRHRRSTRSPASRRAASSSAARWRISSRPASCRSARRASCRTRRSASPIRSNTASTRWRCTTTRWSPGERVLLVDDLIATGGTAEAAVKLLRKIGAEVVAACFVIDLPDLGGADEAAQARRAGPHADRVRGALSVRGVLPGTRRRGRVALPWVPTSLARCGRAGRSGPHGPCVVALGRRRPKGPLRRRTDPRAAACCSGGSSASGPGSWPPANFTSAATRSSTDGWVAKISAKPSRGLSTHISITAEVARVPVRRGSRSCAAPRSWRRGSWSVRPSRHRRDIRAGATARSGSRSTAARRPRSARSR